MALGALASPAARHAAARWLLAACVAGYILTLIVIFLTGAGLQRWFFALLAWALFVYVPLRILLEAFQTIAPAMRRTLAARTALRADRYLGRTSVELMVDSLYDRTVLMPRIATPVQAAKAKAGAVAVLLQTGRRESAPLAAIPTRCLATVDPWVRDLGRRASHETPGSIQARWAGVRAVIALAALTKVLIAAAADQGVAPFATDLDPRLADEYLDICLDYCDDLALQVDVVSWTEPALDLDVPAQIPAAMRESWMRYCETEPPALEARTAFVQAATQPAETMPA